MSFLRGHPVQPARSQRQPKDSGSTVSDLTITAVAGVTVNGTSSVVVPAGASFQLWRLSGDIWAVMSAAGAGAGTWPMVAIAGPTYTITALAHRLCGRPLRTGSAPAAATVARGYADSERQHAHAGR